MFNLGLACGMILGIFITLSSIAVGVFMKVGGKDAGPHHRARCKTSRTETIDR